MHLRPSSSTSFFCFTDMESSNNSSMDELETPDASIFIPSPISGTHKDRFVPTQAYPSAPDTRNGTVTHSGLILERFAIHQGRFGSTDDSSLLEALVKSAYDNFKSVRVVAEGSESVHSFIRALSEEFLNFADAVEVQEVLIRTPGPCTYSCTIDVIYPSVPRFRHLSKLYRGVAKSDRSALHASLSAACAVIGNILITLQPEGFQIPASPAVSPICKHSSPIPSTIDSPKNFCHGSETPSSMSGFEEKLRATNRSSKWHRIVTNLFGCGGKRIIN